MRRLLCLLAALPILPAWAGPVSASTQVRRFAVVVGANRGAPDRIPLRYAIADAERFAKLITQMGGVSTSDCLVLHDPTRQALLDSLATTRTRVAVAHRDADHTEVLVYFSGHADEQGLMLGRELLPYRQLRSALANVAADIGITVLDACASGAITRLKGGQEHPAFLNDDATRLQGYAFLTSSSENEAAQETDRLQGSYFTHALLSGLRGAADASGNGQVTLSEAYQFAFGETLAQTTTTQAGAQHPAWDIKMAGTGDVVMTDVRQTSASLILEPEYDGRFFVSNARRQFVAELYKPYGRRVELGLEPGEYQIHFEQERTLTTATITLQEGQHRTLLRQEMKATRRLPTQRRGPEADEQSLAGRWRAELSSGITGATDVDPDVSEGVSVTRWLREDFALELSLSAVDPRTEARTGPYGTRGYVGGLFGFLLGARYYAPLHGSLRPYLDGAIGPLSGIHHVSSSTDTNKGTKLGASLGGGVDLLLGGHLVLGLRTRSMFRSGYHSQLGIDGKLGWTFGHGRAYE